MVKAVRRRRGERGVTLIEALIAFALLFVVALAVLQLFSTALAINLGSLARTDLTYRAERITETLRVQRALSAQSPATNDATCCPLASGATYTIPASGACFDGFWGPTRANVIEPDARYTLSYTIETAGVFQVVTVEAIPNESGNQYAGTSVRSKAVRYVFQM